METLKELLKSYPEPTTQPQYDDVELTAAEIERALHNAKADKYWRIQEEEQDKRKKAEKQEALRPWSQEELMQQSIHRATKLSGKPFETDYHNMTVLKQLCQYFTNDVAFENDGISDLNKGILLMGPVGTGKTLMLKAFAFNKRQCFLPITANEVESKIRDKGLEFWRTYTGYVPGHGSDIKYFYQPNIGWLIDDIGTEERIVDYGNPLEAIEKILHARYENKTIPYSSLHMTTNLDAEGIEKRYGTRMRSRIREMFNVIILGGSDRRR